MLISKISFNRCYILLVNIFLRYLKLRYFILLIFINSYVYFLFIIKIILYLFIILYCQYLFYTYLFILMLPTC